MGAENSSVSPEELDISSESEKDTYPTAIELLSMDVPQKSRSYVTDSDAWEPTLYVSDSGRKMIGFTRFAETVGPRFGADKMLKSLDNAIVFSSSSSFNNDPLYLVAYPRFKEDQKTVSDVISLIMSEKQTKDIRKAIEG